jgi:SAM-dependent methyltransferase
VDVSAEMVRLARERNTDLGNVTFAEADLLRTDREPLGDGRFDFVSAVAVIHHVDFAAALAAVERLLAPGGRAVIVGLARNRTPLDWVLSGAGVPAARWYRRRNGGKGHPDGLPMKDPAMSWGEIRRDARRLLPGCRFRRHLLWRYSLIWNKPRGG